MGYIWPAHKDRVYPCPPSCNSPCKSATDVVLGVQAALTVESTEPTTRPSKDIEIISVTVPSSNGTFTDPRNVYHSLTVEQTAKTMKDQLIALSPSSTASGYL